MFYDQEKIWQVDIDADNTACAFCHQLAKHQDGFYDTPIREKIHLNTDCFIILLISVF